MRGKQGGRNKKGSISTISRMGRKMHCAICREAGHTRGKCPNKPADYVEKSTRKKALKRKVNEEEAEINDEMDRAERERETGEAQLMEEAFMNDFEVNAPPPATPRRSQRLDIQSQSPTTPRRSQRLDNVSTLVSIISSIITLFYVCLFIYVF